MFKKTQNILLFALFFVLISGSAFALSADSFSDVTTETSHWISIEYAKDNNIVEGYPDGTFKPENLINRAEFTKIIIEAITDAADISGSNCFPDVQEEWYAKYVCTAKEQGLIDGYPDGTFKPENTINFVESSKIIVNGFGITTYNEFAGNWYGPYLLGLSRIKAVPIDVNELDQKINRGQMVAIIHRIKADIMLITYTQYTNHRGLEMFLGDGYSRTHTIGRYLTVDIEGSDGESFEKLYHSFARDKNHGYFEGEILEGSDGATFEMAGDHYARDQYDVYHYGDIRFVGDGLLGEEKDFSKGTIEEADGATFEVLKENFARDKNYVFFDGEIIPGSDGPTFDTEFLYYHYSHDKNQAYYSDSYFGVPYNDIIQGADGATFEYLGCTGYAKDQFNAYYNGNVIEGADAATFQMDDSCNAFDENWSYDGRSKI